MTKTTLSRELGGVLVFFCSEVMVVWRQSKKIDGTVFNRFVRGCSHLRTLGSRGYFVFIIDTDGSRRNRVNEAWSAEGSLFANR